MSYKIHETHNAKKFFRKHKRDKKLIYRIHEKYIDILDNPFSSEFKEITSSKCPKCQRARVGNYRILFYVNKDKNLVEIIDIIHRSNNYRLFALF